MQNDAVYDNSAVYVIVYDENYGIK